jgi:hypothetical protein
MNMQFEGADSDDDGMERLLRHPAHREPYIDDGGFTAAVMARVPPPANHAQRRRILLGFAVMASVFGLVVFGGAAFIWQAMLELVQLRGFGPAQLSLLVFALLFYWALYTAVGVETET